MAEPEAPQIYLITPPEFELSQFPKVLDSVLDARDIACVRLDLATRDEDRLIRSADALRDVTAARDVALVIADHVGLAERLGLDGVHLEGGRGVRSARKALGADAIVGAYCGASRHDGISAAEAGADYISFGPLSGEALGDGTLADADLFSWWSEMIEIPVVAEGGLTVDLTHHFSDKTDFFAFGEEIWRHEDPLAALEALSPR